MANRTEPAGSQRPVASTAEARTLLGVTPKTARRWIKNGTLDGYVDLSGLYHFYLPARYLKGPRAKPTAPAPLDQSSATPEGNDLLRFELAAAKQTIAELQDRVTTAEAKRSEAEAAQRTLLASNALTIEAAEKLSAGSELLREGGADLLKAIELQRGLLAQFLTPDNLAQLPERDW
ncbi:hypothetical protein [Mycolicibacterium conceptionense]|uniref:hypothetical protein n=1 Tax=Mycolicibacterium conceptionense TaxID=451644 RepID=UPI003204818C